MDFDTMSYEKEDQIAVITLIKPERMNVINNYLKTETGV